MSQQKDDKGFRELQRLNYFYAITVIALTMIVMTLLFVANAQQREVLEQFSDVATQLEDTLELLNSHYN